RDPRNLRDRRRACRRGRVGQRHGDDQGQCLAGAERHRDRVEPRRGFRQVHDQPLNRLLRLTACYHAASGRGGGMATPILMYHNVAEVPDALHPDGRCLYVTPAAFAAQMGLLARLGWRGVSMSEAMPYLRGEKRGRIAAITFDDGYLDNLENAMPVLRRHGFSPTCYIVNGCIGKHNLWDTAKLGVKKPMMTVGQLH